jgi:hypothetical protein
MKVYQTQQFMRTTQSKQDPVRRKNMGPRMLWQHLRRVEEVLSLPANSLTGHVWRRSAATVLANSGCSEINLKRAGRWKKLQSAEEYMDHCIPVQKDRMSRLDGSMVVHDNQQVSIITLQKRQTRTYLILFYPYLDFRKYNSVSESLMTFTESPCCIFTTFTTSDFAQ